jgi:peptidoglycan/xylan/chitin deacetylase (PgdA/CDA1 family)
MFSHSRKLIAVILLLVGGCASAPRIPPLGPDARMTLDQGAPVRGDKSRRELAIIFTGGEHGQATATILDILAKRGVKASFFVTGDFLANQTHRDDVKRMIREEHYVGPHSHAHPLYASWDDRSHTLISRDTFVADLQRNIDELRQLHCFDDGRAIYFVPPYEWFNQDQVAWARSLDVHLINMTGQAGSNRDWIPEGHAKFVTSEQIITDVLTFERSQPDGLNGFVLLFHLGSLRADLMDTELERLLEKLSERGYTFRRVDDLFGGTASFCGTARPIS